MKLGTLLLIVCRVPSLCTDLMDLDCIADALILGIFSRMLIIDNYST